MKTVNTVVTVIYLAAMVVLCFFQKCSYDIYFLIAGFAVGAMGIAISLMQEKKLKELREGQEQSAN